jgi:hypothetical protein
MAVWMFFSVPRSGSGKWWFLLSLATVISYMGFVFVLAYVFRRKEPRIVRVL